MANILQKSQIWENSRSLHLGQKDQKRAKIELLKIARSQIFDFCLDWPDLAHFLLLLRNNCSKLHNNEPKMGNRGKNEKSGPRAIFSNPKESNWSKFDVISMND